MQAHRGRRRGTVVKFARERGFGFIEDSETHAQLFVHYTQINGLADSKYSPDASGYKSLEVGQVVEFEIGQRDDRLQANAVMIIEEAPDGC